MITKPTIHMNGDSPENLLEGYRNAMEAVALAQEALGRAAPNARDYYPQGMAAYDTARNEHCARSVMLQNCYDELLALAMHCDAFITERDQRRAERNRP